MLFSRAVNTGIAKNPRQIRTDSAHTSRLPVQHHSIWRPQPTHAGPKSGSAPHSHCTPAHCTESSRPTHHPRSHTTGSENYLRIMPWAVELPGWGKETGSCLTPPIPAHCCASRGAFGMQGRCQNWGRVRRQGGLSRWGSETTEMRSAACSATSHFSL